jgi:hypothetical protein
MTRFALAGKCGCFALNAPPASAFASARSASQPKPLPVHWRKWRREIMSGGGFAKPGTFKQRIAERSRRRYAAFVKQPVDPKLMDDPVFKRVLADALAIQDRFAAEPVYAKTGKGYLKSAGVEELKAIKKAARREKSK